VEHPLSVTWIVDIIDENCAVPSPVATVMAEMDVGPSPQLAFPDSLGGKLVGVAPELLVQLQCGEGVEVVLVVEGISLAGSATTGRSNSARTGDDKLRNVRPRPFPFTDLSAGQLVGEHLGEVARADTPGPRCSFRRPNALLQSPRL